MLRRLFAASVCAALLVGALLGLASAAQRHGDWEGVWRGSWTPGGETSITIVEGRVARYEFLGKPVPITVSKVESAIVTFGVPGRYAIRMTRVGPNAAAATYKNLMNNVVAAADLVRGVAASSEPGAQTSSVCDFETAAVAPAMAKCLPVVQVRQETNLCVPTSAAMTLAYYGFSYGAREIKTRASGKDWDPDRPFTDFTMTYFSALISGLKPLGIHWSEADYPDTEEGFAKGVEDIEAQIDAGHPVLVDTAYSTTGHTFVIAGYSRSPDLFFAADPDLATRYRIIPADDFKQFWNSKAVGTDVRAAVFTDRPQ